MKRFKRVLSMLLALVMTMGMCFTATAAEVTVADGGKNHSFVAYQIFTGTQAADSTALADVKWGTGIDSSKFLSALQSNQTGFTYNVTKIVDGVETTEKVSTTIAEATAGCTVDKPNLVAEALSNIASDSAESHSAAAEAVAEEAYESKMGSGTALKAGENDLANGYYLIVDETKNLQVGDAYNAALLQVTNDISIGVKTDKPEVEKKVEENTKYSTEVKGYDSTYGEGFNDVADYDIGDDITFHLIGSVPDMTYYTTYSYKFHDHMDPTLELVEDEDHAIKVYLSSDKIKSDDDTDVTASFTDKETSKRDNFVDTFAIGTSDLKAIVKGNAAEYTYDAKKPQYIIVEYTARLTSAAQIGLSGQENKVYLQYSNNPNTKGEGTTPEDKVIVFTYEVSVTKQDPSTKKYLEGVKFKLYKTEAVGGTTVYKWAEVSESTLTKWVEGNLDGYSLTDSTKAVGTELITNSDGKFEVKGLDDGTYYIRETYALPGYNTLTQDVKITVSGNTNNNQEWSGTATDALTDWLINVVEQEAAKQETGNNKVVLIENNRGTVLPTTGGIGTTIFYVVGGTMMVGALILLVVKKRMSGYKDEQ